MNATRELLILAAVQRGEFIADGSTSYGFRWNGLPVDYDLYATINNLGVDGLLNIPDTHGAVIELTGRGTVELTMAGVR